MKRFITSVVRSSKGKDVKVCSRHAFSGWNREIYRKLSSAAGNQEDTSSTPLFYEVGNTKLDMNASVVGEVPDATVHLKSARPGDIIRIPYELTINNSFRDFWHGSFYSHDRINTSTPFSRELGLQDQTVPFTMMLFLATSMSHAYDAAKVATGFKNAKYHWPAFAGDTVTKQFKVKSVRTTSDGQKTEFGLECTLFNQRDKPIFSVEKSIIFPFVVPPSDVTIPQSSYGKDDSLLHHLVDQAEKIQQLGSQTLLSLKSGQLLLHGMQRPLALGQCMQLSTIARINHDRHFNTRKHKLPDELTIPAGLQLATTLSMASRDLHEVIHEELTECMFPHFLLPGEVMGAISFVLKVEEHISGDIECVTVRTVGVKNVDIVNDLKDTPLPVEMFLRQPVGARWQKSLEMILSENCPVLSKNIVCIADRKLYRPAPKAVPFLL